MCIPNPAVRAQVLSLVRIHTVAGQMENFEAAVLSGVDRNIRLAHLQLFRQEGNQHCVS